MCFDNSSYCVRSSFKDPLMVKLQRQSLLRSRITFCGFCCILQMRLESAGGQVIGKLVAQLLLPISRCLCFRCCPHKCNRLFKVNHGSRNLRLALQNPLDFARASTARHPLDMEHDGVGVAFRRLALTQSRHSRGGGSCSAGTGVVTAASPSATASCREAAPASGGRGRRHGDGGEPAAGCQRGEEEALPSR
uniref:Uncharacterized protein n=1 Tax=Arundo donax TaxID=35708 RepID=A0A0A9FS23_ARUDO